MGWFDDSDSSDEEQIKRKTQPLFSVNGDDAAQQHDNDDEEDTLDAYMKSLQQQQSSSAQHQKSERLDVEGQDEATRHWEEPASSRKGQRTTNSLEEDGEEEEHHDDVNTNNSSSARLAMASTFHRAGQKDKQESNNLSLKLERVQHDSVDYIDIPKTFWKTTDTHEGHSWRRQHSVTCTLSVNPILDLEELHSVDFGKELLQRITKKGYTTPTLVQSQTLPVALSGRDAIITAATGSGKTLAYVWPMVTHVRHQDLQETESGPIGLVLVPTRELALQVHRHVKAMSTPPLSSVAVTGGTSKYQLSLELKKKGGCVHVVVATPGRLLDVLSSSKKKGGGLSLSRVSLVVLDEADKMLDMGFEIQVSEILQNIRPDRQSLLLSATMGRKVEQVCQKWLSPNAVRIAVGTTGESSRHVDQHVMVLPSQESKTAWLKEMVPILSNVGRTLVFVNTRADCERVAGELSGRATVATLHGDKHQTDRNAALRAFKAGSINILIATDVAARGLDIPHVSTVVNLDAAKNLDAHVHRIGRAGRLDKDHQNKGTAYTLLFNNKKNADFAQVLKNAFEREGREVSPQLQELASRSKRAGNVASRTKWNKAGLGFDYEQDAANSTNRHYGPAAATAAGTVSINPPPAKKSRWG